MMNLKKNSEIPFHNVEAIFFDAISFKYSPVVAVKAGITHLEIYDELLQDVVQILDTVIRHNISSRGWGEVTGSLPGKHFDIVSDRFLNPQDLIVLSSHINESLDNINTIYEQYKIDVQVAIPYLKHFALTNASGLSGKEICTRVDIVVCLSEEELDKYFKSMKTLEQQDHRKLGRQMDLFIFRAEAPGMVFWLPRGYKLWRLLEDYIRKLNDNLNMQEVSTPVIASNSLWVKSGHMQQYSENIFLSQSHGGVHHGVIKPMNCPLHALIFKSLEPTYKDLPIRLSEFGYVHRNEPSGSMFGLFRARAFTQDDGHHFCTTEQMLEEIQNCISVSLTTYASLGFPQNRVSIKLALRPEASMGDNDLWIQAESVLTEALTNLDLPYEQLLGEGAFYGPKIEFHLQDVLGRSWQCGTIQIDFFMPKSLDCTFVSSVNSKEHPILIHRAVLGSMERFIGILIENNNGYLPLLIAPEHIVLCNLKDQHKQYARNIASQLESHGVRVKLDLSPRNIQLKIKEAITKRIPILGVIGAREIESDTVSISLLYEGTSSDQTAMTIEDIVALVNNKNNRSFLNQNI
jgi:threonyl-tRNA synthetase